MKSKSYIFLLIVIFLLVPLVSISLFSSFSQNRKPSISLTTPTVPTAKTDLSLLKNVCQQAVLDYSNLSIEDALVVWEDKDKAFYYRRGPKASSVGLNNPCSPGQKLQKLSILDKDNVGYWLVDGDQSVVGTFNLNHPGNKQIIAKLPGQLSGVGFINSDTAITAINKGGDTQISLFSNQVQTSITEVQGKISKLTLSPQKDLTSIVKSNNAISIFNVNTKKEIGAINKADESLWLGNNYLLYRNGADSFLYDLNSKASTKIENLSNIRGLSFHPGQGGIIGFTNDNGITAISCSDDKPLNANSEGQSIVFANSDVAFVNFQNGQSGYWEFNGKSWVVKLSDQLSIAATLWDKY